MTHIDDAAIGALTKCGLSSGATSTYTVPSNFNDSASVTAHTSSPRRYYAGAFPPSGGKDTAVLDICSSWISHYPKVWPAATASFIRITSASDRPPPLSFAGYGRVSASAPRLLHQRSLSNQSKSKSRPSYQNRSACLEIAACRTAPPLRQGYTAGKISGLGMNEAELKKNTVLTDFAVRDLNRDPTLPYPARHPSSPSLAT